jgi:hypothetical protein
MEDLKQNLEAAKLEAVKRMPNDSRYAAMSAHLSACLRVLEEIEEPENGGAAPVP